MRISKDKAFERLIKTEKGKSSHRLCEINKRHKRAELMQVVIQTKSTNTWEVPSQTEDITYIVCRINDVCTCKLSCRSCGACVHMYTCSCMDAILHATVCKHSHLVHMRTKPGHHPLTPAQDTATMPKYFSNLFKQPSSDLLDFKQQVQKQTDELRTATAACQHLGALQASIKHIQAAVTLLKAVARQTETVHVLPQKRKCPPNKNSDTQPKFFSTKKQKISSAELCKPNRKQTMDSKLILLATEVKFCGICFKEDDSMDRDVVEWIQCSRCQIWIHQVCTMSSTEYSKITDDDNYLCVYCQ